VKGEQELVMDCRQLMSDRDCYEQYWRGMSQRAASKNNELFPEGGNGKGLDEKVGCYVNNVATNMSGENLTHTSPSGCFAV
jgi:hypothetical protein